MAPSKLPSSKKPEAPKGETLFRPGVAQLAPNLEQAGYKGAVPLRSFLGWVIVVVATALGAGLLGAHLLVQTRQDQLVEETNARVAMQAQGRTGLMTEWLKGVGSLADTIAKTDLVRLYLAESGTAETPDAPVNTQAGAVRAQKPYLQQWMAEFVKKNRFAGIQLVDAEGRVEVSVGDSAEILAAPTALKEAIQRGESMIRPLTVGKDGVVMDVIRPVRAMAVDEDEGRPVGAVLLKIPVGDKLAELLAATPLDQPGERTALLQKMQTGGWQVVGRTSLAPLQTPTGKLEETAKNGGHVQVFSSVVDGRGVFALLSPVQGTPLALLQEYVTQNALSLMVLYKPVIFTIVTLLVVILAALMLALTLHLMGQRNRTRVKLLGQTMEALVRVVESRDPFLAGHHERVARLTIGVGNALRLGVAERATLFYAAQLAAVGRLLVPRTVLAKSGKLTGAERKELENHITQSVSVLGDLDFDLPIVPVISQMYERVDGSGHPSALKGEEILPLAKVLGACDAYVALTSERAHRKAFSKAEAIKALQSGAFDPAVIAALKAAAK